MIAYAKIQNGTIIYPQPGEFRNIPNVLSNDALLRRSGYLPLIGEPEPREGFTASPARWHVVEQTEMHTEPRQVFEDVMQEIPVGGAAEGEEPQTEIRVVGQRMVMRDTEVTTDASYIQVDDWSYEAVPEPPPVVPPPHRYSKLRLHRALDAAGIWETIWHALTEAQRTYWQEAQELADDDAEFSVALATLRSAVQRGDIRLPSGVDIESILAEAEI
jgi:hypothetical protein